MDKIEFKLGNIVYSYHLTKEQQELLALTEQTEVDLNAWDGFSTALHNSIIQAIPDELKPPTEQEIQLANNMAKNLNLGLPDGYRESARVCRVFINQHQAAYDRLLAMFNGIKGQLLKSH
ncbi:hypothetical protein Q8W15_19720 [Photobacterium damselae subsp. piscicida]|nr:hypothetical protein [Photobacterium damselae subsp. piscicida]